MDKTYSLTLKEGFDLSFADKIKAFFRRLAKKSERSDIFASMKRGDIQLLSYVKTERREVYRDYAEIERQMERAKEQIYSYRG